jgi:S1-C subfamily serine protease
MRPVFGMPLANRFFGTLLYQCVVTAAFCQSFDSAAIVSKVAPAVVFITGITDNGGALGSGFIISSDGRIATSLHVIRDYKSGGVQLPSGDRYDSFAVLAFDERKDIAVIKIAAFDLPTLTLGNSNTIQVGEPVLALGNPHGLQGSVSTGIVSSVRDDPLGRGFKVIQTDAAINFGNSGGPLVNERGEVVAIVQSKRVGPADENIGFAIPINYLRGMIDGPLSAFTLDELRAKLAGRTDVFQRPDGFPTRWKSLASGTIKTIRRDGDHIYVETVLPEAEKQAGCFSLADLRKQGESYVGTTRFSCVCQYQKHRFSPVLTNNYSDEESIEITKLAATRIEGMVNAHPQDGKFDCEKRTFSKPAVPQPFVWIPE